MTRSESLPDASSVEVEAVKDPHKPAVKVALVETNGVAEMNFSTGLIGAFGSTPSLNVSALTSVRYRMIKNQSRMVKRIFLSHGMQQVVSVQENCNVYWIGGTLKPNCISGFSAFQRINRFPRSFELTRKSNLYNNINFVNQRLQVPIAERFIPEFYCVSPNSPVENEHHIKGVVIVKPVGLSRGRGIYLAATESEIKEPSGSMIVCRYIQNPFLMDGLKFDIRLYVAVTSFRPLVAYLYREGLVRFAPRPYADSDVNHLDGHLTNYSMNKKSSLFRMDENNDNEGEGHKWSLTALLQKLRLFNIDTDALLKRIEDVVVKTLLSCKPKMSSAQSSIPHEGNCFELFGFDILLDSRLKIWLLEVNLSPSLSTETLLDYKVKSRMLCDLFSLACIPELDISKKKGSSTLIVTKAKNGKNRIVRATKKFDSPRISSPKPLSSQCAAVQRLMKRSDKRSGGFERIFPKLPDWEAYRDWMCPEDYAYDYELHQRLAAEVRVKSAKSQKNS